jgi:DNA-binding NarL/FixJ family response regulator
MLSVRVRRPRVLVIEDQPLIGMAIGEAVEEYGAEAVGPAIDLDQALKLAYREELDAALLDIWLGKSPAYAVGEILMQRGIPFIVIAGRPIPKSPFRFRTSRGW